MTAAANATRQAAYRARKAAAGVTEVRGIFAPPKDHQQIKAKCKPKGDDMTTPDLPPLPEPFVPLYGDERHKWADQMRAYGDARAAAAVLAERERLSSPEAVAEAAMLLGAFSADENASAKALLDAARTMFGAETVAAVLTKYKSKEQP